MQKAVLVLNAGSSSVKFCAYEFLPEKRLGKLFLRGQIKGLDGSPELGIAKNDEGIDFSVIITSDLGSTQSAIDALLAVLGGANSNFSMIGVGHRIVHGGPLFASAQIIDDAMFGEIRRLIPLAPMHQPHNLYGVEAAMRTWPNALQIACFDTAFHRGQPAVAQRFALPQKYEEQGVIRYGFHGLSYQYIAHVLSKYLGEERADGRVIVAHLGQGASMCAIKGGKSVATTMGFTALDGLPMGKRCGAIDPGAILHIMREENLTPDQMEEILYYQSGLLGVSGMSSDMRTLLQSDEPRAKEAISLFSYRAAREIGSLAAVLGGLDALVFTAGIGENSHEIRAQICEASRWLGVRLDGQANRRRGPQITSADSEISAWVIPTDEESVIADDLARLI